MSDLQLVQSGWAEGSGTCIFVHPNEPTGILRVARSLHPSVRTFVADMGDSIHDRLKPYAAEERALEIVSSFRREQRPEEPLVVFGYCLAGTVTALVAKHLTAEGCKALVLVDAPMPGHPYPYVTASYLPSACSYWRQTWLLRREGKLSGTSKHALKRKLLWHTVRLSRPFLKYVWSHPFLQKKIIPAIHKNETWIFPTMPAQRVPILNFVCADQNYFPMHQAVMGWAGCARAGYRSIEVPGDHGQAFFRGNIPRFAAELNALFTDSSLKL